MFSGVPIQRLHSKTECVTAVQQKAVPIQIFLQMQPLRPLRIQRIDPLQHRHFCFEREREREREIVRYPITNSQSLVRTFLTLKEWPSRSVSNTANERQLYSHLLSYRFIHWPPIEKKKHFGKPLENRF